ncbi:hypothetical protein BIZ37_19935 [Photobacterium sp. BZF1]|uniref:hypothetical protein n=1 Tax=Photobacterium sp. BZF1 TaxID=1904457 RepID=UPI001653B8CC|nr:hypothetical protein [Photobacterium sp. BZF1]MBC7004838.1 hypothetical protein [Photobacterium sp. BZF1]
MAHLSMPALIAMFFAACMTTDSLSVMPFNELECIQKIVKIPCDRQPIDAYLDEANVEAVLVEERNDDSNG